MGRHHGCLLIPRGVQFLPNLFPQILIPHNHAAPYSNPQMGEDAPFVTIGPFAGMDTLFHGTAGDLDLYMTEEVVTLKNTGVFKSSITELPTATPPSLTALGQVVPPPLSSKLPNTIPRWNQTPLPGSETSKFLLGATAGLYPWLLEVAKTWISQSMSAMLHTNDSTEKSTPDASEGRKARSVRSTVTPKAEAHTLGSSLHMSMVQHSSAVALLTWVFQVSILDKPTGAGLTNADACTHTECTSTPPLFSSTLSLPLTLDIHGFTWHSFL